MAIEPDGRNPLEEFECELCYKSAIVKADGVYYCAEHEPPAWRELRGVTERLARLENTMFDLVNGVARIEVRVVALENSQKTGFLKIVKVGEDWRQ